MKNQEDITRTQNALLSVVGSRQFTLMSDGGHASLENERILAKPEFMEGLSKQGIKHVFLEISSEHEPAAFNI